MGCRRLVLSVVLVLLLPLLLLVAPSAASRWHSDGTSVRMPNETLCGQEYLTNGVVVEASHFVSSQKYFSCVVKFMANTTVHSRFRWVLRIERMFIPYTTFLFPPAIYIHTSNETLAIEYQKDFSNLSGAVIVTQRLALQFVNLPQDSNYKLFITLDTGDENCTSGFKCLGNHYCIDRSLLCDGEDHCGDSTDESDVTCPDRADKTPIVIIVGGSVVLALLVGLAVLLVVLCRSKRSLRYDNPQSQEQLRRIGKRVTYIREPTRNPSMSLQDATATYTRRSGLGYQPAPLVLRHSLCNQANVHHPLRLTEGMTSRLSAHTQTESSPSSPESIDSGHSESSSALLV